MLLKQSFYTILHWNSTNCWLQHKNIYYNWNHKNLTISWLLMACIESLQNRNNRYQKSYSSILFYLSLELSKELQLWAHHNFLNHFNSSFYQEHLFQHKLFLNTYHRSHRRNLSMFKLMDLLVLMGNDMYYRYLSTLLKY